MLAAALNLAILKVSHARISPLINAVAIRPRYLARLQSKSHHLEYEEVLRDAEEYWKILEPGGFLIGDDYHETWPGVVRAAGEFSARCLRALTIEPPKWILQKTT